MKPTIYMRIAKSSRQDKVLVCASSSPNYEPLYKGAGISKQPIPTVAFAVEFDIPESLFHQAESVLATVNVESKKVTMCKPKLVAG